jgi:23S rRNA pseudouridine2605 synthase
MLLKKNIAVYSGFFTNFAAKYFKYKIRIMTANEKWHGSSKNTSNSGAGRDGNKPYEKRYMKSILKGSRGAAKFNSDRPNYSEKPNYDDRRTEGKLEFRKRDDSRPSYGDRKPYENREGQGERRPYLNRDGQGERRPYQSRPQNGDRPMGRPRINRSDRPYGNSDERPAKLNLRKPGEASTSGEYVETRFDNRRDGVSFRKPFRKRDDSYDPNSKYSNKKQTEYRKNFVDLTKPVRLNKFLANAGICSRREADEYIQAGIISVNGEVVSELGVKVMHSDKVMFHNQVVRSERKVYILLNKPKDCVTTSEDTHDRMTVLDLVKNACSERIYPVGRLDRNTTGVILLTNDGDLASKLTHPKYDKKKIYHVALDKPLEREDFEKILAGVNLDDFEIAADSLEFVKEGDPKQVGIEIHSGQNRVVRRIFEKLGYKVIRLDRVYFAGLTKKGLPRGKYRFLNDREVNMLKMGAYE